VIVVVVVVVIVGGVGVEPIAYFSPY